MTPPQNLDRLIFLVRSSLLKNIGLTEVGGPFPSGGFGIGISKYSRPRVEGSRQANKIPRGVNFRETEFQVGGSF